MSARSGELPRLTGLLLAARPPAWVGDYPSPAELETLLSLPEGRTACRLWPDESGGLVAFALVDTCNNLLFELNPAAADLEAWLEAELVTWGVAVVRERAIPGEAPTLDAVCREEDVRRIALLERQGFERLPVTTLRMVRPLAAPLPEPTLPPGFRLRPLSGREEVPDLVALHRAAFGTEHLIVAERLAEVDGPGYNAYLDLVVEAPGGRLAGYCTAAVYPEENARTGRAEGHTDPVAVHPDYQRRGLARALLLAGLQRLRERGLETAVLGTSSENQAMQAAARSAGFEVESARVWLSRSCGE